MIESTIDWVVMWNLFHYQFWWICLGVGVPIRFLLARRVKTISTSKAASYGVASSIVASILNPLGLSGWATRIRGVYRPARYASA